MGPIATNTVTIRIMDYTVHQDAIVSTRIVTISMAVTSLGGRVSLTSTSNNYEYFDYISFLIIL